MANRKVWVLICLVLLSLVLSGCDPASMEFLFVDQVLVVNGFPYIHVQGLCSYGIGDCQLKDFYFMSSDGGYTWQQLDMPPAELTHLPDTTGPQTRQICLSGQPQICYLIQGTSQVNYSSDGGRTWQVDWSIPQSRVYYVERRANLPFKESPTLIPYDLAVLESATGHTVIAAWGNQGVLLKSPASEWIQIEIKVTDAAYPPATPIPLQATSLTRAIDFIGLEVVGLGILSYAFGIMMPLLIAHRISREQHLDSKLKEGTILLIAGLFSLGAFPSMAMGQDLFFDYGLVMLAAVIVGLAISIVFHLKLGKKRIASLKTMLLCLLVPFILFAAAVLPLILWCFGSIPDYRVAVVLAAALFAAVVLLSLRLIRYLAAKDSQTVPANHLGEERR